MKYAKQVCKQKQFSSLEEAWVDGFNQCLNGIISGTTSLCENLKKDKKTNWKVELKLIQLILEQFKRYGKEYP